MLFFTVKCSCGQYEATFPKDAGQSTAEEAARMHMLLGRDHVVTCTRPSHWEPGSIAVVVFTGNPLRSSLANSPKREWIIRRCTQRWVGTELIYEDWPVREAFRRSFVGPLPGLVGRCDENELMVRDEMTAALDLCVRQWPDEEFAGHNVANCRCADHEELKALLQVGAR
jgi:hypothetical protein